MTWAGFWIVFLIGSLVVYSGIALVVSVRGGAELADLLRRNRR